MPNATNPFQDIENQARDLGYSLRHVCEIAGGKALYHRVRRWKRQEPRPIADHAELKRTIDQLANERREAADKVTGDPA